MSDLLRATIVFTRMRALLLVVVVSVCWAYEVIGAVYKWVDDNGKVHYSDKPPAQQDIQEMEVEHAPSVTTPGLTGEQRLHKQQRVLDAFAKERADKKAEQDKLAQEKQERKVWCARAKDELREISEAGYLYDYDENGEMVVLSKERRAQATSEAEAQIKKKC